MRLKIVNDFNGNSVFIDIYYDIKLLKNFIIICNEVYIKSYDYKNNILYHKYYDKDKDQGISFSIIIRNDKNIVEIIS